MNKQRLSFGIAPPGPGGQVTGWVINRNSFSPFRQREPISFENQTLPAESNWDGNRNGKNGDGGMIREGVGVVLAIQKAQKI